MSKTNPIERLKKQARALHREVLASEPPALARVAAVFREKPEPFGLMRAQHVIAVEYGFKCWDNVLDCPESELRAALGIAPHPYVAGMLDRMCSQDVVKTAAVFQGPVGSEHPHYSAADGVHPMPVYQPPQFVSEDGDVFLTLGFNRTLSEEGRRLAERRYPGMRATWKNTTIDATTKALLQACGVVGIYPTRETFKNVAEFKAYVIEMFAASTNEGKLQQLDWLSKTVNEAKARGPISAAQCLRNVMALAAGATVEVQP